jgi:hypothetical protein
MAISTMLSRSPLTVRAASGGRFRIRGTYHARRLRILLADDPCHLERTGRVQLERALAGQQFIEQNTQCVDVGGSGDLIAAHLLGAGVLRRHHPFGGPRLRDLSGLGVE